MRSSGAADVSIEVDGGIGGVCGVRRGAPRRESVCMTGYRLLDCSNYRSNYSCGVSGEPRLAASLLCSGPAKSPMALVGLS